MSYLLVGVGGLGCELAKCIASNKNLLLGLEVLHLIDFDTIEISNLNRQLLFNSSHVGKFKAEVAKGIIEKIDPSISVACHINSIYDNRFDINFFKEMNLVINALDNNKARSYVSRMCLDAKIDLIDGGSAGFLGQVRWFLSSFDTECFNCYPAPEQKTYPTCTIRNNPTEFVHCVIWAKHLFHVLFGDQGSDNDYFDFNQENKQKISFENMFDKIFYHDIKKLEEDLSFSHPVRFKSIKFEDATLSESLKNYAFDFKSLFDLFEKSLSSNNYLVWTKDDDSMVKFVYAVSNLRAHVFDLSFKSEFETKTIAGNIIPSVVTTNAIVSGLMLSEIAKYFSDKTKLRNSYINSSSFGGNYISPVFIPSPNEQCLICQNQNPCYTLKIDFNKPMIENIFKFIKLEIGMINYEIMDESGNILKSIDDDDSSEESVIKFIPYSSQIKLICIDYENSSTIEIITINDPTIKNYEVIKDDDLKNGFSDTNGVFTKKLKL